MLSLKTETDECKNSPLVSDFTHTLFCGTPTSKRSKKTEKHICEWKMLSLFHRKAKLIITSPFHYFGLVSWMTGMLWSSAFNHRKIFSKDKEMIIRYSKCTSLIKDVASCVKSSNLMVLMCCSAWDEGKKRHERSVSIFSSCFYSPLESSRPTAARHMHIFKLHDCIQRDDSWIEPSLLGITYYIQKFVFYVILSPAL